MNFFKQQRIAFAASMVCALAFFMTSAVQAQALFDRDLRVGMQGSDVRALQQYLNQNNFLITQTGSGSPGKESNYFGLATKKALIRFQEAHAEEILQPYGLTKGTGNFFAATRKVINASGNTVVTTDSRHYTVGGSITGITGRVVLQNNDDELAVQVGGNAMFVFPRAVASGERYTIAVKRAPAGQSCFLSKNQGVVQKANVNDIRIACMPAPAWNPFIAPLFVGGGSGTVSVRQRFSIGGTVTGLAGTMVLQNNGGDNLTLTTDGAFTFATKIDRGDAYAVSVLTHPTSPAQSCTVSGGSGVVGSDNVTSVSVSCTSDLLTPTLSLANIAKNWGDSAFTLTASSTSAGTLTYTSSNTGVATISGSTVTITGVGTTTITVAQAATDVYRSSSTTALLTVSALTPTITFNNISKSYGDAAFVLTPSSPSAGAFSFISSNTSVATVSGSTTTIVAAGTTTITVMQAAAGNYSSASTTAVLTVNGIPPSITFNSIIKYTGDDPFALDVISNSAGSFSFLSSLTSVATVSGNTCTIVGPGTTVLTANQAANGNYASSVATTTLQVYVNQCITDPCSIGFGGASCTPNLDSYTCTCVDHYSGVNCEMDNFNCKPDTYDFCLNGGTCVADAAHGHCSCVAPFTGEFCSLIED